MIKCNNCGAKNPDNTKICAVCGKEINSNEKFIDTNVKIPWYGSTWFIILMLFYFPPVGFYLMWKHKKFNNIVRVIITVSITALWVGLIYYNQTHPEFSSSQPDKKYTMKVTGITIEEIGNIEFKVPEYYDVRVTNDDVYNVHFYPERKDAQASLGFILMNQNYSAEQVKSSHENIINNWKQTFANIHTEEEMRDSNYILKATGSRDGAKMKAAALVNDSTKKTVVLVLSVDDTDTTGIDYFGDFDNIIKKCQFKVYQTTNEIFESMIESTKKNGWVEENGYWYYYKNDQKQKSKFVDGYYVDEEGKMLTNITKKIKGKNYKFDKDGKSTVVEDLELVGGINGTKARYDGYFASYISGVVKNNTDKEYSYLQISFDLYDSDGNKVGTALANENDIGPGETWKFEAIAFADFSTYKLDEITGW